MKIRIIYIATFILLLFLTNVKIQAQITRGAISNEIYIATDWYVGNGGLHYAILHSTDNGENISIQYENIVNPPAGEMKVGQVLGDATSGALYNYGWNKLWVSFDYGESWEYREDFIDYIRYWGGGYDGVIYKGGWGLLHKSNDYAQTYFVVSDPPNCPISDIGYFDAEFYGIDGNAGEGYYLYHTLDYANTYTEIPIDSTVAFWQVSSKYPEISRGTEQGELYLVSWWPEAHYKIFHSTDTGCTWTLKYQSDYINLYYWGVQYTAGRQPGSFYVKRSTLDPTFTHSLLYIDYSNDYGETFTTYFHDLDSLYTGIQAKYNPDIKSNSYPNPFTVNTTITFTLPINTSNSVLQIFNSTGKLIRKLNIDGKTRQQWEGLDDNGNLVPTGIYLYHIKTVSFTSRFHKLLFIH